MDRKRIVAPEDFLMVEERLIMNSNPLNKENT